MKGFVIYKKPLRTEHEASVNGSQTRSASTRTLQFPYFSCIVSALLSLCPLTRRLRLVRDAARERSPGRILLTHSRVLRILRLGLSPPKPAKPALFRLLRSALRGALRLAILVYSRTLRLINLGLGVTLERCRTRLGVVVLALDGALRVPQRLACGTLDLAVLVGGGVAGVGDGALGGGGLLGGVALGVGVGLGGLALGFTDIVACMCVFGACADAGVCELVLTGRLEKASL